MDDYSNEDPVFRDMTGRLVAPAQDQALWPFSFAPQGFSRLIVSRHFS